MGHTDRRKGAKANDPEKAVTVPCGAGERTFPRHSLATTLAAGTGEKESNVFVVVVRVRVASVLANLPRDPGRPLLRFASLALHAPSSTLNDALVRLEKGVRYRFMERDLGGRGSPASLRRCHCTFSSVVHRDVAMARAHICHQRRKGVVVRARSPALGTVAARDRTVERK